MKTFLNKKCALPLGLIFLISINFSPVISENLNINVRVVEDLESTALINETAMDNYSFFEQGISYLKPSGANILFALAIFFFLIIFFVIFIKLRKRIKDD